MQRGNRYVPLVPESIHETEGFGGLGVAYKLSRAYAVPWPLHYSTA